jgi:hypothetical protein
MAPTCHLRSRDWALYARRMRELLLVAAMMLGLAALAALVLVDPARIMAAGRALMLISAAVSLPLWALYFGALGTLARSRAFPAGWYWNSFESHRLLRAEERFWILGCFGAAAFTIAVASLGILVVVAAGVIALVAP